MSVGERGPVGDHGQMGDTGQTGATGATGEKGERGVNPWVVRRANLAYALLAAGLFLFVAVSQYQERQNDARYEAAAVAIDRAFCALAVDNRTDINSVKDAVRTLEAAVRQSYELVVPSPDATALQRQRTNEFRMEILAQLDTVKIPENRPLPECSGIGNGQLDFSLHDAVTGLTTTTRF